MYDWLKVRDVQKLFFLTPEELKQPYKNGKIERTPLNELPDGRIEFSQIIRAGVDARPDTSLSRWILGTGKALVSDTRAYFWAGFLTACYTAYQRGLQEG